MMYKLGTVMGHIGHAPPETMRWEILKSLGIDVELAKRAVHKLYFEESIIVKKSFYEINHDVFFIPNNTKYGTLFSLKYRDKINE